VLVNLRFSHLILVLDELDELGERDTIDEAPCHLREIRSPKEA